MNWISIIKEKLKPYPKMSLEETNQFLSEISSHINLLENSPEYPRDKALQSIVEILKTVKTKSDLKKQKDLINHIAIDSVENWKTIEIIGEFLKSN